MRKSAAVFWIIALALWAGAAGARGEALKGHGGPVRALALLEDGRTLVTGGFDSAIIVWDLGRGTARRVLRFHDSTVNALVALAGGCFASGGEDGRIALWCGEEAAPRSVLTGHTAPIAALTRTPDGRRLVSAGWDRTVRAWPLSPPASPAGPEAARVMLDGHQGPVNGVAVVPDGSAILSAGYDGQLRLAHLVPGRAALALQGTAPVNAVAVAPDGEIVTAGADGVLRFYGPALEPMGTVELGNGPLTTLAVSPDGTTLATVGLRTPVTLVARSRRSVVSEIVGPGLPVWSLAFADGGRELLTGGVDRAIRRWDPATGRPVGADIAAAAAAEPETKEPGALVFRACRACHGLAATDTHLAGPTLHRLFGRRIATQPGYVYSDALKRLDIVWTAETVARLFEVGPNAYTPGTKMPEQRITSEADRRALVEWLARVTTD
jgi:cytochrome c